MVVPVHKERAEETKGEVESEISVGFSSETPTFFLGPHVVPLLCPYVYI